MYSKIKFNFLRVFFISSIFSGAYACSQLQALAQEQVFNLTLNEASELALKNNFEIQLAKYDVWVSRTQEGNVESIYDTVLRSEINYTNDQLAKTSTLFGTKTVDNNYNVSLTKQLPTGTELNIGFDNNRNANNSSFTTSPVTHDSNLGVSINQDLGKNFFGLNDRNLIKATLLEIEGVEYVSLDRIEQNLAEVQKAYWDLVEAKEQVDIEKALVGQAEKLFKLNKEKLNVGAVEDVDAIAAEANYLERLSQLKLADNNLSLKENAMRLLLNITDDSLKLNPTTEMVLLDSQEDLQVSLVSAFKMRQDYKSQQAEIRKKKLELVMAKNSLWPEINVQASLARNGLGDHFNQSINNISDEDNPELFLGVVFEVPLENTKSRSSFSKVKLENAKALLTLKYLERKIGIVISDKVSQCNILREVAQNAVLIANLHEEKIKQEESRYSRGRSDTDTLIRFQKDLSTARLSAIRARNNYQKAVIDLRKAEGALLQAFWRDDL